MVAEFKKEAVLKEIGRLSAEVDQGKRIIEEAEERQQQENEIMSRLGMTMQQVSGYIYVMIRWRREIFKV